MGRKLYVGNLSYSTESEDLQSLFAQAGTVTTANVITDRDSGRSKGFAFVEMSTDDEAQDAVTKFDGYELSGRQLKVAEARPRPEGGGGGGGFRRGGRGGGGGGWSGGRDRF